MLGALVKGVACIAAGWVATDVGTKAIVTAVKDRFAVEEVEDIVEDNFEETIGTVDEVESI